MSSSRTPSPSLPLTLSPSSLEVQRIRATQVAKEGRRNSSGQGGVRRDFEERGEIMSVEEGRRKGAPPVGRYGTRRAAGGPWGQWGQGGSQWSSGEIHEAEDEQLERGLCGGREGHGVRTASQLEDDLA